MIEILALFSFVLMLGLVLLAKDWAAAYRTRRRRRYLDALMGRLEGRPLGEANAALGEPTELAAGSEGRLLSVWKDPAAGGIPEAAELVIVTIVSDAEGRITKAAWESR
ncbi:MAG: hypothetical protein NTX13_09810 [Acidobacteria bacterium]|jgi:hypothetical protein|nr:hypothetical protein [Acidobacteriota bacterium]